MSGKILRKPIKHRQTISLEKKIEILDKLKLGQGSTSVAGEYGLNESTVRTIKRMEGAIRKSAARGTAISAKRSTYKRNDLIEAVEEALVIWIRDNNINNVRTDSCLIRKKALKMFSELKEKQKPPSTIDFSASKGWFENFKRRHNLKRQISDELLVDLVVREVPKCSADSSSSDNEDSDAELFSGRIIADGLRLGQQLQTYFLKRDPDTERAWKFQKMIKNALSVYEETYKNSSKNKQMIDFVPSKSKSTFINNEAEITGMSICEPIPIEHVEICCTSDSDSIDTKELLRQSIFLPIENFKAQ